jgi:hypothetical protein
MRVIIAASGLLASGIAYAPIGHASPTQFVHLTGRHQHSLSFISASMSSKIGLCRSNSGRAKMELTVAVNAPLVMQGGEDRANINKRKA